MQLRKLWFTLVQVAYDIVMKLNPRKLAAHAVIADGHGRVLVLRSRYADLWGFPGGGLNRRENLDEAVARECLEEMGLEVAVEAMTGFYYHTGISAYVGIFRCRIVRGDLRLSHEHAACRWTEPQDLPDGLRRMAEDALDNRGQVFLRTMA